MGSVAWITVAPVKSLALVHRDEVELEPFGVRENRRFYLVDDHGRMINGKVIGALVRVVLDYDDTAGRLRSTCLTATSSRAISVASLRRRASSGGRSPAGSCRDRGRRRSRPWRAARSVSSAPREPGRRRPGLPRGCLARRHRLAGGAGERRGRRPRRRPPLPDALRRRRRACACGGRLDRPRAADRRCRRPPAGQRRPLRPDHAEPRDRRPDLDTLRVLGEYRGDIETASRCPWACGARSSSPAACASATRWSRSDRRRVDRGRARSPGGTGSLAEISRRRQLDSRLGIGEDDRARDPPPSPRAGTRITVELQGWDEAMESVTGRDERERVAWFAHHVAAPLAHAASSTRSLTG